MTIQVTSETRVSDLPESQQADTERSVEMHFAGRLDYIRSLNHKVTEVRIFRNTPYLRLPSGKRNYVGKTVIGYFDDIVAIEPAIAPYLNDGDTSGIYTTLQGCDPALLARSANGFRQSNHESTKNDEVVSIHAFPIDIDPERPSGISSSKEELLASREQSLKIVDWFSQRGIQAIRGMSGNGYHLLIYLHPEDVGDDTAERFKDIGDRIVAHFGTDEKVYNLGRVWKLYGTHARKGSHTELRPHRLSKIELPVNLDDIPRYTFSELYDVICELPSPTPPTPEITQTNGYSYPAHLNGERRFHGDTREEWEHYAQTVLGVSGIGKWNERKGYAVARCNCIFCGRSDYGKITYTNGKPGLTCHSNTCSGKRLEDAYLEKGIAKSVYNPQRKSLYKPNRVDDKEVFKQICRDFRSLGYSYEEQPAASTKQSKDGVVAYEFKDVRCDVHPECKGVYYVMHPTTDNPISKTKRFWECKNREIGLFTQRGE